MKRPLLAAFVILLGVGIWLGQHFHLTPGGAVAVIWAFLAPLAYLGGRVTGNRWFTHIAVGLAVTAVVMWLTRDILFV